MILSDAGKNTRLPHIFFCEMHKYFLVFIPALANVSYPWLAPKVCFKNRVRDMLGLLSFTSMLDNNWTIIIWFPFTKMKQEQNTKRQIQELHHWGWSCFRLLLARFWLSLAYVASRVDTVPHASNWWRRTLHATKARLWSLIKPSTSMDGVRRLAWRSSPAQRRFLVAVRP